MKKFTFKTIAAFVMIAVSTLFFRCSKNNNSTSTPAVTAPTVTTTTITFSPTSPFVAVSGGSITSVGNGTVTAYGICYSSTNPNPDLTSTITNEGQGITTTAATNYVSYLSGLTPGTTYNVRAYATNSAGTSYGNLMQFTTGAASWTQVFFSGGTALKSLSGISFSDDNNGFAFGINTNNQVMFLSTSNSGATWSAPTVVSTGGNLTVTNNGGSLPTKNKSICFTNSNNGWITYGGDSVLTTLNGGTSWGLFPYTTNAPVLGQGLSSTCFTGLTTGFVAGLGIYKTTTGSTWTNVAPSGVYFNSVYFVNATVGFASTVNSIYRTTNGGNFWQAMVTTSAPVYGFSYANGVLFAAGSQSLLVSTDNGATWNSNNTKPSPNGGSATIYNVCFMSQSFGVVATSAGLYQTIDGGSTWTSINSSGAFNDVCHTSNHIFAISGTTILRL